MLYSPLDQFRILPVVSAQLGNYDFSFTNSALILVLSLGSFLFLSLLYISPRLYTDTSPKTSDFSGSETFFVPNNRWFLLLDNIYLTIGGLLQDNLGLKGESYLPYVFTIFLFVLLSNLIGLIPYSFTPTSHIVLTLGLALMVFIGVTIIGINRHKIKFLNMFMPGGTDLTLAFLIVPLEVVSYLSKPISLSVRLFANMMAGHTLLKVIAGFAWSMMKLSGLLFLGHLLPLIVLFLLVGLELGVAMIQAYVFTVLTCIYLNDSINLH